MDTSYSTLKFSLDTLSPLDNRYREQTSGLAKHFSEKALFYHRWMVELKWLKALVLNKTIQCDLRVENRMVDEEEIKRLTMYLDGLVTPSTYLPYSTQLVVQTKLMEEKTNHDVKAVEYMLRKRLKEGDFGWCVHLVHFGCTSEDINSLAYATMINSGRVHLYKEYIYSIQYKLCKLSEKWKNIPMLARTHGQPATPTTLGKEIQVYYYRYDKEVSEMINKNHIHAKFSGATGNYNAHVLAYPDVDWREMARKLCSDYFIEISLVTTQVESNDCLARLAHHFVRLNNILLDFCQDIWLYISQNYLTQITKEGEVGSSTMPHKVNPIDFENAEGNLGLANAMLNFMADKLTKSRLQRDLSNSTVMRNWGVAFGYCAVAYSSILKGLDKIQPNESHILNELDNTPEVLTEAIQIVMKRYRIENSYEKLKELSRGKPITYEILGDFIKSPVCSNIPGDVREKLLNLKPSTYLGVLGKDYVRLNDHK